MNIKAGLSAMSIAVCLAMSGPAPVGAADIQGQMNSIFDSMSNFSRPGVFETQRRGVLSGGSLVVRDPIVNTNLINAQLPSFDSGCGGIDLFGGSLSFISRDQFIVLLRAIAANAKGYAFKAALGVVSPYISNTITELQHLIQQINNMSLNSCEMAQGILTDPIGSVQKVVDTTTSLATTAYGLFTDYNASRTKENDKTPASQQNNLSEEKKKEIIGNIVWQQLQENGAERWLAASDAADMYQTYELIMSISGTWVIGQAEEANDGTGETNTSTPFGRLITMKSLIEGGTVATYSCNGDRTYCLNPSPVESDVTGLKTLIMNAIQGVDGSMGVISKFRLLNGNSFTQAETNVMSNLPDAAGAMIRNMALATSTSANDLADKIAYAAAMSYAYQYIDKILARVTEAVYGSKLAARNELLNQLRETRASLTDEYNALAKEHPTLEALVSTYSDVMAMSEPINMLPSIKESPEFMRITNGG